MNQPTVAELRVIELLFPELANRLYIDWDRMNFSDDSLTQIANVLGALEAERTDGWVDGYAAGLAEAQASSIALADEFDAQVPWPHSWIGNRIREAAGVEK